MKQRNTELGRRRSETKRAAELLASWYGYTDAQIADLFVRRHGSELRYVPRRGWFEWEGAAWGHVPDFSKPCGYMLGLVNEVRAEVASWRANYPLEVDSILSRSALGSVRAVSRILKLASKDPRIARSVRDLKHERGECPEHDRDAQARHGAASFGDAS